MVSRKECNENEMYNYSPVALIAFLNHLNRKTLQFKKTKSRRNYCEFFLSVLFLFSSIVSVCCTFEAQMQTILYLSFVVKYIVIYG